MAGEAGQFIIRQLLPDDVVNKFEIAHKDDALRAFLKKLAAKFNASNVAKTYVAVEDIGVKGLRIRSYISILLSEIRKDWAAEEDCPEAARYNHPAVKIARLATDRNFENRGLASQLIDFVVGLTADKIMPHVGCRFLILDANREKIEFYKKRGFVLINNEENLAGQNPVMFMDLHKSTLKVS